MDQTTKKSKVLKAAATKGPATEATTSSAKKRKRGSKKGKQAKETVSDAGSDYDSATSPPKKKKGVPAGDTVKAPTVEWSLDPTLTEALLDYFEDPKNQACRIALKFSQGEGSGKTDGRNQRQHLEDVAKVVLIEHESGLWAAFAPKDVYLTIKNRLGRMRDIYKDRLKKLEGTGQGLAEDDPAGYANLIEQRDTECPYYARLHDLLRDDPSINKSAVVNSRTIKESNLLRKKKKSEDEEEMEDSDGPVKLGSNDDDEEEEPPIAPKPVVPADTDFVASSDESGIEDQPAHSTSSRASARSEISTKSKSSTKSGMSHRAKGMFGAVSELMNEVNDTRMDQEAAIVARQFRAKKEITRIEVEGRLKVARLEAESKERLETKRMELEMKRIEMEHERKMAEINGRNNQEWDGHYNPAALGPSSSTPMAPQYADMDLSAFGGYGGSFPGSSNMNK